MRTFVYQFGIALRDAKVLAIPCAVDKRVSRSTPNAYVAADIVTPILRHGLKATKPCTMIVY